MKAPRIIIYILIGVFLAQCSFYYPNLPETMASHFNGAGEPDGWMSKNLFFIFEGIVLLLILAEFTLLPLLMRQFPKRLINLPNKDYWLAPDRFDETHTVIRNYFEWFSILLISLFIAVNQMVFQANIASENLSSKAMWLIMGAFFAFVILWLIKFIRRFRVKDH